ncbi:MAG: hypothetical protein F4056_05545 [Chloroflexi bacterium]|nr:hypothetical protein [Chloroflexota bacterium]
MLPRKVVAPLRAGCARAPSPSALSLGGRGDRNPSSAVSCTPPAPSPGGQPCLVGGSPTPPRVRGLAGPTTGS